MRKEVEDTIDYEGGIIFIISRIQNKHLLKRIYNLAEYLCIYEDKPEEDTE